MYEVTWSKEAEAQLSALWLAARDRLHISEVTKLLDKQLHEFPEMLGESREPGSSKQKNSEKRIAFESSFTIQFRIDHDDHTVTVTSFQRNSNPFRD